MDYFGAIFQKEGNLRPPPSSKKTINLSKIPSKKLRDFPMKKEISHWKFERFAKKGSNFVKHSIF